MSCFPTLPIPATAAPMTTDARPLPNSLLLFALFYGGMVTLAGVLGAKQVALGPLAIEAGVFPFQIVVGTASGVAELHGKPVADRLARFGFAPLVGAILITLFALQLPTDPGMYEPAKAAFPIVLGQSWRMMAAGIIAYGVSLTLNLWIFERLRRASGRFPGLRGFVAAACSQLVDTVIFISVSFYGVRPIAKLMAGQMIAKVTLSAVLVPAVIWLVVRLGRRIDAQA